MNIRELYKELQHYEEEKEVIVSLWREGRRVKYEIDGLSFLKGHDVVSIDLKEET